MEQSIYSRRRFNVLFFLSDNGEYKNVSDDDFDDNDNDIDYN